MVQDKTSPLHCSLAQEESTAKCGAASRMLAERWGQEELCPLLIDLPSRLHHGNHPCLLTKRDKQILPPPPIYNSSTLSSVTGCHQVDPEPHGPTAVLVGG